jgi:hypothetical protein
MRARYPTVRYLEDGWFIIPDHPLPAGWNRETTDAAIWARLEYPGTQPYGIYVPTGIRFVETVPNNYSDSANPAPPDSREWGLFSWTMELGWQPTADVAGGSNLLKWARGIEKRFAEGV